MWGFPTLTKREIKSLSLCFVLEVWKADDQVEKDPREPDKQARSLTTLKNQPPTEERGYGRGRKEDSI